MSPLLIQVLLPLSVQPPSAVIGAGRHGADVRAGVGLAQCKGGDLVAARDGRQVGAPAAPGVPASVMAPLPRPCIANAKSASGE